MEIPESEKSMGDEEKSGKKGKLPKGSEIQTRPIMHPPIPSPFTGADQPKIIYISRKTSLIGTVKRVRKLLSLIEKRTTAKVDLIEGKGSDKQKLKSLDTTALTTEEKKPEAVTLKATNRAIEKALRIALYLQQQGDLQVRFNTDTIGVIDDVITGEPEASIEPSETRIRSLSVLKVFITMK